MGQKLASCLPRKKEVHSFQSSGAVCRQDEKVIRTRLLKELISNFLSQPDSDSGSDTLKLLLHEWASSVSVTWIACATWDSMVQSWRLTVVYSKSEGLTGDLAPEAIRYLGRSLIQDKSLQELPALDICAAGSSGYLQAYQQEGHAGSATLAVSRGQSGLTAEVLEFCERVGARIVAQSEFQSRESQDTDLELLVSCLSHDALSPLHTLQTLLGMIRSEMEPGLSRLQRFVELALLQASQSESLLFGLASLLREPEASQRNGVSFDLVELSKECLLGFAPLADELDLSWELLLPEEPLPVVAEAQAVQRILINVLSNSFKYTREGEIKVSLAEQEGAAVVTISDTGIGMSEQQLEVLSRPFTRFCAQEVKGLGLGMASVAKLCAHHRISLKVVSALGEGTSVILRFPLLEGPCIAVAGEKGQSEPRRLLLIDDDPTYLKSMQRLLMRQGASVYCVSTVKEIEGVCAFFKPDAIVSDYHLGDYEGDEEMLEWYSKVAHIPLVVVTGENNSKAWERIRRKGATAVLTKPVSAHRLWSLLLSLPRE